MLWMSENDLQDTVSEVMSDLASSHLPVFVVEIVCSRCSSRLCVRKRGAKIRGSVRKWLFLTQGAQACSEFKI